MYDLLASLGAKPTKDRVVRQVCLYFGCIDDAGM
jgi:hypothetical protein